MNWSYRGEFKIIKGFWIIWCCELDVNDSFPVLNLKCAYLMQNDGGIWGFSDAIVKLCHLNEEKLTVFEDFLFVQPDKREDVRTKLYFCLYSRGKIVSQIYLQVVAVLLTRMTIHMIRKRIEFIPKYHFRSAILPLLTSITQTRARQCHSHHNMSKLSEQIKKIWGN